MADIDIFLALTSLSFAKFVALALCRQMKLRKMVKVGTVKSIFQFPVKSAGAKYLDSAVCTTTGLYFDGVKDR